MPRHPCTGGEEHMPHKRQGRVGGCSSCEVGIGTGKPCTAGAERGTDPQVAHPGVAGSGGVHSPGGHKGWAPCPQICTWGGEGWGALRCSRRGCLVVLHLGRAAASLGRGWGVAAHPKFTIAPPQPQLPAPLPPSLSAAQPNTLAWNSALLPRPQPSPPLPTCRSGHMHPPFPPGLHVPPLAAPSG